VISTLLPGNSGHIGNSGNVSAQGNGPGISGWVCCLHSPGPIRHQSRTLLLLPFVNSLGGIKFKTSQIIGFCGCRSLQVCLRFGWKGESALNPDAPWSNCHVPLAIYLQTFCGIGSLTKFPLPSPMLHEPGRWNSDATMLNVGVEASASAGAQSCQTKRIFP